MTRIGEWAILLGVVLIACLMWAGPYYRNHRGAGFSTVEYSPVGTTGHDTTSSTPEPDNSPATLHDLGTVMGTVDKHPLIGQRVDFHERVRDVNDDSSFWVGNKDNKMLVIPESSNGIQLVKPGQMARITGTIELNDQMFYIRADNVTPEG